MFLNSLVSHKLSTRALQKPFFALLLASTCLTTAQAVTVSDQTSLINAINAINAGGSDTTITLSNSITLNAGLPPITRSAIINGGNFTIDGGTNRLFTIGTSTLNANGSVSTNSSTINVVFNNLTLQNGRAIGGQGSGGGMGAGGAIYVTSGGNVSVNSVQFAGNQAFGGQGMGAVSGSSSYGLGGGGMAGGVGTVSGNASTPTGGTAISTNGSSGAAIISSSDNGTNGGYGGGGSGNNGSLVSGGSGSGGNGGYGGGGGGTVISGAGNGGVGGFGGGGGATTGTTTTGTGTIAAGGFAAGSGGTNGGGGGAGLGGAIYVERGGTLSVGGTTNITSNNTASGGVAGGPNGQSGVGSGGAMFLQGAGNVNFNAGAGNTLTVGSVISDQYGLERSVNGLNVGSGNNTNYNNTYSVTVSGPGTVVLNDNNIYSGGTIVNNGGTLAIGNNGALGLADTTLTLDNGTLVALNSMNSNGRAVTLGTGGGTVNTGAGQTLLMNGAISGAGALNLNGAGTTTISGVNSYNGGTNISNGTVAINNSAALGADSTALSLSNGATLLVSNDVSLNHAISLGASNSAGVAGVLNNGGNNLTLLQNVTNGTGSTGSLNFAGASAGLTTVLGNVASPVLINAGTHVQIGNAVSHNGGAAVDTGTISGAIVNNGILDVNRSTANTLAGAISGTGALNILGGGNTTLSGNNSYSGGTNVNNGSLTLGSGGTLGTGTVALNNGSNFSFNPNAGVNSTVGNVITGTGSVTQTGAGITTLTGVNTYSGGTNVNNGTIALGNSNALGTSGVNLDGGALQATQVFTLTSPVSVSGAGGTFNNGGFNNFTIGTPITGTGNVTAAGSGTTVFTGANTYVGNTNVTGGALELQQGGRLGTGNVNLSQGTRLNLNSPTDLLVNNPIAGAGALWQIGAGTSTLTGANTYTGGTHVLNGALNVNGNGSLGTGGVEIASPATVNMNTPTSTLNSPISGTGNLNFNGTSGTILGDSSGFGGTTHVNTGALNLGNGTIPGTLGGNIITASGTDILINPGSGTVTVPANISGAGRLTTNGTGTTILTGNVAPLGTTIAGGTLQVGNGTTQGTLNGPIVDNGTLAINNPNPTTLASVISGTGGVNVGSPTTMTAVNTYTGPTNIGPNGVLTLANGGLVAGNIVDNGRLVVDNTTPITLNGAISGVGSLTVNGHGTGGVNLNGPATYTGGTTVNDGILNVLGSLNSPLTVEGTGSANIGGSVNGAVTNNGTGTVNVLGSINGNLSSSSNGTLAQGASINGDLTLNGGTYLANGTVTGTTHINSGTLAGSGHMGTVLVHQNGTISPSNSLVPTTMTTGNLNFDSGGTYRAGVTATAADRINVNGTATLSNGSLFSAVPIGGGHEIGSRYTVLSTTNGVNGTFSQLITPVTGFGTNIRPRLVYNANAVDLILSSDSLTPMTTAMGTNQQGLARVYDALVTHGAAGANIDRGRILNPLYDSSQNALAGALSQTSGEIGMSANRSGLLAGSSFMGAMMDQGLNSGTYSAPIAGSFQPQNAYDRSIVGETRLPEPGVKDNFKPSSNPAYMDRNKDLPNKPVVYAENYSIWATAIGSYSQTKADGNTGAASTEQRAGGIASGITYRPNAFDTVGFALAGSTTGFSTKELGSGTNQSFSAGVYGRIERDQIYFSGNLGAGLHSFETSRSINITGVTDTLSASFNGQWVGGRGELGYKVPTSNGDVSPYVAFQTSQLTTGSYTETSKSNSGYALSYASRKTQSNRSEVGVSLENKRSFSKDQWMTVRGMIAWSHEFTPSTSMAASLTSLPGAAFVINGARQSSNALLIGASTEYGINRNWSINARITGELSNVSTNLTSQVGAKYNW